MTTRTPTFLSTRGQFKPPGVPRINWQHPLAQGLQFYAFDTGGVYRELVKGRPATLLGTRPGAALSAYGYATKWTTAGGSYTWTADTTISTAQTGGSFSWACGCVKDSGATLGSNARPFGRTAENGSLQPFANWDFEFNNTGLGSGTQTSVNANIDTAGSVQAIGAANWPGVAAGAFCSLLGTMSAVTANALFYGQGQQVLGPQPITAASDNTNANIIVSGSSSAAASNQFGGWVYYGAFWSRTLGPAEALQLHTNPYQFLIFPQDEVMSQISIFIPPFMPQVMM